MDMAAKLTGKAEKGLTALEKTQAGNLLLFKILLKRVDISMDNNYTTIGISSSRCLKNRYSYQGG
jgi:hypothetical protein